MYGSKKCRGIKAFSRWLRSASDDTTNNSCTPTRVPVFFRIVRAQQITLPQKKSKSTNKNKTQQCRPDTLIGRARPNKPRQKIVGPMPSSGAHDQINPANSK